MSKKNIWLEHIHAYVQEKNISEFFNGFFIVFEDSWNNHLVKYKFDQMGQLENGNRLRPMLVYWGYLLNKSNETIFKYDQEELEYIVKFCIAIESIHKMSLLIDDIIDKDVERHGQPTFHVLHGQNTTILLALNLIMKGFIDLYKHLELANSREKILTGSLYLLIKTAYEMTDGALEEVTMDDSIDIDVTKVKHIIDMETSSIIKHGLVLGYNVGEGNNGKIEKLLSEIGHSCGYIFQSLNDLEPFGNSDELKNHKGRLSTDALDNRKNIVIAYIYSLAKRNEIIELKKQNTTSSFHKNVKILIDKYEIIQIIYEEIDVLTQKILSLTAEIEIITGHKTWSYHFEKFINILIEASKKRALE